MYFGYQEPAFQDQAEMEQAERTIQRAASKRSVDYILDNLDDIKNMGPLSFQRRIKQGLQQRGCFIAHLKLLAMRLFTLHSKETMVTTTIVSPTSFPGTYLASI